MPSAVLKFAPSELEMINLNELVKTFATSKEFAPNKVEMLVSKSPTKIRLLVVVKIAPRIKFA